jgi:hypothetical protein
MASTFSPDLRIELIGAGDQAGTWGTTTNTNLGTIVEAAIAGYISVSITSANQAFTALDGLADQARNAIIALTTTTAANFAVYAPPASKQYIIYNTTAYTATVYNSTVLGNTTAAGLGVTVAAGSKVVMFSDGTDFRAVDTANFAGVLPVLNGGTGQTSYTNGQLLIGNTTGNTLTKATLTAGSGISVTNSAGGITIAATGGGGSGTVTSITAGTGLSGGTITTTGTIAIDSTVATLTGSQTLTNKTLTSPAITTVVSTGTREVRIAIPASNIDLATGNYFSRTISGATTLTVSNVPTTGTAVSFILDLTNGGSAAITWWSGTKWAGGAAPTLTASGRDVLGFFTYDGGTTWTGLLLGRDVK